MWIPLLRPGSNLANNQRGPPIIESEGGVGLGRRPIRYGIDFLVASLLAVKFL
jgi:hypothetical protein